MSPASEPIIVAGPPALDPFAARPQSPPDLVHEAQRLFGLGHYERALPLCEQLVNTWGDREAWQRLPFLYRFTRQWTKALDAQRGAIRNLGESAEAATHLSYLLFVSGDIAEGLEQAKKAAERYPTHAGVVSNYLFSLNYDPGQTRQGVFEAHCQWGQRQRVRVSTPCGPECDPDPDRPLRIGYLSSDFWRHSVSYTFEPFLSGRDPSVTAAYGYSLVENPDDITAYLAKRFDRFLPVLSLKDQQLAAQIRADRIDILVVIGGHIGENRLSVCAHGPAPIIVDYGSPCTLGNPAIDYRLTDAVLDPPASQEYYLERLACLGDGLTCYAPLKGLPEPGVLPAKRQGGFTFGSFNASPKINPVTIALWARALHSVKNSRLMLKFSGGDDAGIRQRFLDRFARRGIAPERIVMHGWMPQSDHFALYDQVDVALDTFPYNGGITTLESLWMGVPVLSMWGDTAISRVGLDLLGRLDMSFSVAGHADAFVGKAACLAKNLDALQKTRLGLRTRMRDSPLCDAQRFGRQVEGLYREMWRRYVQGPVTRPPE